VQSELELALELQREAVGLELQVRGRAVVAELVEGGPGTRGHEQEDEKQEREEGLRRAHDGLFAARESHGAFGPCGNSSVPYAGIIRFRFAGLFSGRGRCLFGAWRPPR